MDSEIENLEATAQAIGIISFIPVILYALWADAIERSLLEHPQEFSPEDLENESNKLKMAHLIILIFQFSLYLESPIIRQAYPLATHLTLITVLSIQIMLHLYTDRKLFPQHQREENLFLIFLKMIRSWVLGIFICSVYVVLLLKVGFFLISHLTLSSQLEHSLLITCSTLAMILGFITNYALAPFYVLKTLPCEPLGEHPFKEALITLFQKHALPLPQVFQINLEKFRMLDLSLLGFKKGKSIFQYSLFISKPALQHLSEAELDSLLKNELSHSLLNHPRKKLIYTYTLLILSTLFAILAALFVTFGLHRSDLADFSGITVGIACLMLSFKKISKQSKDFELEADLYTLTHLDVTFVTWANSLRKLDQIMLKNHPYLNSSPHPKPQILPETEHRIQALAACLPPSPSQKKDPDYYSKAS